MCAVCLLAGVVGFLLGLKWGSKGSQSAVDQMPVGQMIVDQKTMYICSKQKPECFHLQPVCGGVSMLPVRMCEHCKKKKWS